LPSPNLEQITQEVTRIARSVRRTVRDVVVNTDIDYLPIRKTLRTYTPVQARADASAALDVALLTFPQALAYAAVAGLPIAWGLFGAIVACVVGGLFAGSRFIQYGPTNATAVLLLASFLSLGVSDAEKLAMIPTLLCMTGLFLILGAWFRVAGIIQYISRSVITGYICAAALFIIVNQTKPALGMAFEIPPGAAFLDLVRLTVVNVGLANPPTVLLAAFTVTFYLAMRSHPRKLPVVALTLVAGAIMGVAINTVLPLAKETWPLLEAALGEPVALLGTVSITRWEFALPDLRPDWISQLASVALVLAFLSVLEGSSIGKSLAARSGERLHTDQEMFAMGMSNLACGFYSGMPASGSLTRSAQAYTSGAATPVNSLLTGGLLLVGLIALGPLVRFIPQSVLAVIIIFVGISLFNRRHLRIVTRATQADAIVFATTFAASLLVRLDFGIVAGAAMAMFLFIRKVSTPELVEYSFTDEGHLTQLEGDHRRKDPEISIVHVEGDIFFGAAELFRDQIRRVCEDENLRIVILKMRNAYHLDATSVMALEELIKYMNERGRTLLVAEARKGVVRIFKRSGLLEVVGRDNVFPDVTQNPTLSTARALRRAQQILGRKDARITIFAEEKKKQGDE